MMPDKVQHPENTHIAKQAFDKVHNIHVTKIFSGDWYITDKDEMLVTILGSCVTACIRDPIAGVGGMNHFLLPGDTSDFASTSESTRYGAFAMESLINAILKAGGRKERLEIKVFGGGNVTNNSARIGSKNAQFIRKFLKDEGYIIASEDLEGDSPRRIHYYPKTGKVMMRKIANKEDTQVIEEENKYRQKISQKPVEGDIDLF